MINPPAPPTGLGYIHIYRYLWTLRKLALWGVWSFQIVVLSQLERAHLLWLASSSQSCQETPPSPHPWSPHTSRDTPEEREGGGGGDRGGGLINAWNRENTETEEVIPSDRDCTCL